MPGHDIIVIGASAGGVEAITQLVENLPEDLPAALFVVLHLPSSHTSLLPAILNRKGALTAVHPADGEAIQHGRIYVAPPDHHLVIRDGHVHLSRGPKENGHRPAVDPLFRSAARAYGGRVIGVILSGAQDDGTAGLAVVKMRGGVAVVQEPGEALYPNMPRSAIENVKVDHVLPIDDMTPLLARCAAEPVVEEGGVMQGELEFSEDEVVQQDKAALERGERPGEPTVLTCPDCGGVLWELDEGKLIRFRCHVGHVYSAESLLNEQSEALELALWTAVRALEEKASLARRMAARSNIFNNNRLAARFEAQAENAEHRADLVRQVLFGNQALTSEVPNTPNSPPVPSPIEEQGGEGGGE